MNIQGVKESSLESINNSRRKSFEKSHSSPELIGLFAKNICKSLEEEYLYKEEHLSLKEFDLYPTSGQTFFPKLGIKKKEKITLKKNSKSKKKFDKKDYILQLQKKSLGQIDKNNLEELLTVLASTINDSNIDPELKHSINQFIASIVFEENYEEIIGEIIFLLDRNPNKFFEVIQFENRDLAIEALDKEMEKKIHKLKGKLHLFYENHVKTGIQNAPICLQNYLCFEIANLLFTKKGRINFGIVPIIFASILSNQFPLLNYEYRIFYTLLLLENSVDFRRKIIELKLPTSPQSLSLSIIRIQVQKKRNEIITKRENRLTALTALMSHLRQGSVGSCFATQMANILLSSHLNQCIEDFSSILKSSKLTRTVGIIKKDFPFLLRIGDNDTSKSFFVHKEGKIFEKEGFLWECPGIISACNVLEIDDPKITILYVLEKLNVEESQPLLEICIDKLLLLLTEHQVEQNIFTEILKMKYFSLAQFAFESQTRNGLLTAWENSLAEMAEGKEKSMIRPAVLNSISRPFYRKIKFSIVKSLEDKQKIYSYFKLFYKNINDRLHLHYDPKISKNSELCKDTTEGGYIIYDKKKENINKWIRIDSPYQFSEFVKSVFSDTFSEFINTFSQIQDIQPQDYFEELLQFLGSKEYQNETMVTYYPSYLSEKDLIERWEEFRYTPWRTLSGNFSEKVREVYMEDETLPTVLSLNPAKAKNLLNKLINFFCNLSMQEQNAFRKNSHKKIPVISQQHAFSLILGHPSFLNIIDSNLDFNKWYERKYRSIINKLNEIYVSLETQFYLINFISEKISIEDYISINRYSHAELRNELVKCIKKSTLSEKEIYDLILKVDKEIFEKIPSSIKDSITKVAVHFADTNWRHLSDIHFCCTINPCTNKFSILQINDDGDGIGLVKLKGLLKEVWSLPYSTKNFLPKDDF